MLFTFQLQAVSCQQQLTRSKEEGKNDEEVQDVPAHPPVDEETVVPLQEKFPHEDGQNDVVEYGKQPCVFQRLSSVEIKHYSWFIIRICSEQ